MSAPPEAASTDQGADGRRHVVCAAADLPAGARRIVQVDGRSIGVFNVHGRYYALRNLCPHRWAPLCLGRIRGLVVSDGP